MRSSKNLVKSTNIERLIVAFNFFLINSKQTLAKGKLVTFELVLLHPIEIVYATLDYPNL